MKTKPSRDWVSYLHYDVQATTPRFEDLPEGWQDQMLDMFSVGASNIEVFTSLEMQNDKRPLTQELYDRFIKEYPEFKAIVDRGRAIAEAWWTRQGRVHLDEKEFNHIMWYMQMKNRFGWRDTIEQIKKLEKRKFAKQQKSADWIKEHKPPEKRGPGRPKKTLN